MLPMILARRIHGMTDVPKFRFRSHKDDGFRKPSASCINAINKYNALIPYRLKDFARQGDGGLLRIFDTGGSRRGTRRLGAP